MTRNLKIIVVGGGVGGLCLAQGLKKAGVEVAVYERDAEPTSRLAGYRLSISSTGAQALQACLPAPLFERFTGESGRPVRAVTFLDHHLRTLLAFNLPDVDRASPLAERPIARAALRRILLAGLDDIVHFGKRLVACEESDGQAIARFADGTAAVGDLIVGADGANSPTRACLLPGVGREDLGIVAIGGKIPLDAAGLRRLPAPVRQGPTLVIAPRGHFMFASALTHDDLEQTQRSGEGVEDYAMWGVSAPRSELPAPDLSALDADALREAARGLVRDWSPALRDMVEAADAGSLTTFPIRAAKAVMPWRTRRITLLGDALHNMPPYRGVGANVALWDAALLTDALSRVERGGAPLKAAVNHYERQIIANGFSAVRRSVAAAQDFHARSPIRHALVKTKFRAIGLLRPLRDVALGGR